MERALVATFLENAVSDGATNAEKNDSRTRREVFYDRGEKEWEEELICTPNSIAKNTHRIA